jgi:hypothetical protein
MKPRASPSLVTTVKEFLPQAELGWHSTISDGGKCRFLTRPRRLRPLTIKDKH